MSAASARVSAPAAAESPAPTNDVSFSIEVYVSILNEQGIRCTPHSLLEYFKENKLVGLYEEKRIMQAHIDSGFGDIEFQISEHGFITIERVKR